MAAPSVAQYTLSRLSQLGLDRIFGVPGLSWVAYVEVMIPNEESQPLPESTIDSGYKLTTPSVG